MCFFKVKILPNAKIYIKRWFLLKICFFLLIMWTLPQHLKHSRKRQNNLTYAVMPFKCLKLPQSEFYILLFFGIYSIRYENMYLGIMRQISQSAFEKTNRGPKIIIFRKHFPLSILQLTIIIPYTNLPNKHFMQSYYCFKKFNKCILIFYFLGWKVHILLALYLRSVCLSVEKITQNIKFLNVFEFCFWYEGC